VLDECIHFMLELDVFWVNICVNFYFTQAHYTICHLTVINLITQTVVEEEYKLWISSLSRVPTTSIVDKCGNIYELHKEASECVILSRITGLSDKHSYRQPHASTRELHKYRWLLWLAPYLRLSQKNWEVPNNCTSVQFQQNGKLTTSDKCLLQIPVVGTWFH
jgi:hypothetical protein